MVFVGFCLFIVLPVCPRCLAGEFIANNFIISDGSAGPVKEGDKNL